MRKPVALILGAIMALSLAPMVSRASAQCPGAQRDPGSLTGLDYKESEIVWISSGPKPVPANPAEEDGVVNLGSYGCRYTVEDGVVDTRYITPGSTFLQVRARQYPGSNLSDNPPGLGCVKFATGGTTSTCTGTGEKKLSFHVDPFVPVVDCTCWISQNVTIPSTAKVATACVRLREYGASATQAKNYCTTYQRVA